MWVDEDTNVIISKSFKTASSTLHILLKNHANGDGRFMKNDHYPLKLWREMLDLKRNEVTGIVGIRNPWDYVSSAYHWSLANNECPTDMKFHEFVLEESEFNWQKQLKWWNIDEIDDVIVFEDLESEINRIAISYNIPEIVGKEIGHYKRTKNSDIDYRELYDDVTIRFVEKTFWEQLQFFNNKFNIEYTFEDGIKPVNSL